MQRADIYVREEDARKLDYIRSQLTPAGLAQRSTSPHLVGGAEPLHEALDPILKRYNRKSQEAAA